MLSVGAKEIEERSRILFPNMQKQNDENRKEDLHFDSEHDTLFRSLYHDRMRGGRAFLPSRAQRERLLFRGVLPGHESGG